MTTLDHDLARLGDELERATGRTLRHRRRVRVGLVTLAAFVLVGGTAVAATVFTPREVAAGMPAGSAIFGQTDPTCVLGADGHTFHCTLTTDPTPEPVVDHPAPKGTTRVQTGPTDYAGWKEIVAVDGHVAGGCIGQDHDGRHWDCWMGELAVQHDIISRDFLGEKVYGPGVG